MMKRSAVFGLACALSALLVVATHAQGTAFTYQGFLKQNGNPVNGTLSMTFRLYNVSTSGTPLGTVGPVSVAVQNGLFTTELNFGNVWNGDARYLEIQVGSTTLTPRVKINPTPYAIRAGTANPIGSAGGDLSGTYPNPTVAKIQGRSVSTATPSTGQVLKWNGSAWAPASDNGGTSFWQQSGSNIYYNSGNVGIGTSSPAYRLHVETSTGSGIPAIYGYNTATSGTTVGVEGRSAGTSGRGVYGWARATSGTTYGVYGLSSSTSGTGVYGWAAATSGTNYGVYGKTNSINGYGGYFVGRGYFSGNVGIGTTSPDYKLHVETSSGSIAIYGYHTATSGTAIGVEGRSDGTSGTGVYGWARATSGTTYGVHGISSSTSGRGVYGEASATSGTNYGVYGESFSTSGRGVYGEAYATSGTNYGVYGKSNSNSGVGVYGYASATSGTNYGVYGQSASTSGRGVYGWASATSGDTYGVYGKSNSPFGTGVQGEATATWGPTYGVYGRSDSTDGRGVYGWATATSGPTYGGWFISSSTSGRGVFGFATATSGTTYGVYGSSSSTSGYGVYSYGRFTATGTKSFQIDHPLSPETHYLNHFCTEGPEPYNVYRGNVVTDAKGYATITLPDYFESINRDPTYHLTVVDGAGEEFVQARVVREIQNNQFVIRTSKPFVKVSWRVEAIRNDLWVQRYGYQTEQEKPEEHRGKYLSPELYGQPKEKGIHYTPEPERLEPNEAPVKP